MHKIKVGDRVRITVEGNVLSIDEDGVNFKDYRTGELHYWAFDDCEIVPPTVEPTGPINTEPS
jgi:hypothetical protein